MRDHSPPHMHRPTALRRPCRALRRLSLATFALQAQHGDCRPDTATGRVAQAWNRSFGSPQADTANECVQPMPSIEWWLRGGAECMDVMGCHAGGARAAMPLWRGSLSILIRSGGTRTQQTVRVEGTRRCAVVHNIGRGAEVEDVLFEFEMMGHYRFSSTE